jgi:hypothetical protein
MPTMTLASSTPTRWTTLLLGFLLIAMAIASTAAAAEPGLEVSIAVSKMDNGERVLRYSAKDKPHFDVVVTNISNQPQRIWREWCSWGYFDLDFELTDQGGKTWKAKKKPANWTRNFPSYQILEPHDSLVIEVEFANPDTWEGFPHLTGDSQTLKMRAFFEIHPDEETKKFSVWTGRVTSQFEDYTFHP